MKPKKSQGPSLAAVAGSAVLLCAVLVGSAYWLRDDTASAPVEARLPAASTLQSIVERCESDVERAPFGEGTRTRCTRKSHPAFMVEIVQQDGELEHATMMVPMGGDMNRLLDRMLVGLDLFGAVAGVRADHFLPKSYTDALGTSETELVYQGRSYRTKPIAGLGLVFSVTRAPWSPGPEN